MSIRIVLVILVVFLTAKMALSAAGQNTNNNRRVTQAASRRNPLLCQPSPQWQLSGLSFPRDLDDQSSSSSVKLVALLRATCGFGLKQASRLEELRNRLRGDGYRDIDFIVVNAIDSDYYVTALKERVSFPVLQNTHQTNLWRMYNASTFEMLVFDKCNRLAFHLKLPNDVVIHNGNVRGFLMRAYRENVCGECNQQQYGVKYPLPSLSEDDSASRAQQQQQRPILKDHSRSKQQQRQQQLEE